MKFYTFALMIIMLVEVSKGIKFNPEVQKNSLKFGYSINYKYEGMLANSFDRFYKFCKLQVEVADVEVKITSMQGMHIFRRDRMAQLIKCTPLSMRLCPQPTISKKMGTFLEVENKMGLIIPAPANQFTPPLPETNPNIKKNYTAEKRKRATPKKRFRPATHQNHYNTSSLTGSPTKAQE